MKKILSATLALALILSLGLSALADTDDRQMVVAGTATVSLPADTASLELGTSVKDATVEAAQQQSDEIIRKVLAALKDLGIEEKDIVTSNYSVYTEVPYEEYGSIRKSDPVYNVSNMLNIKVRNLENIGKVIDAATKAGANQIYGLTFSSSKEKDAYKNALERAVEDARSKAEILAKASGKTLGSITRIENQYDYGGYYDARNQVAFEASVSNTAAIVSGAIVVSATVTLTYEID